MPQQPALVTGASSGIGEALARGLAERGNDLVLVARTASTLEKLATRLMSEFPVKCDVFTADLSVTSDVEKVAEQIRERSVSTVVNNAGYGSYGAFRELPIKEELAEIQLNISALVALSHAALEVFVPRRSGNLLNVASTASFQPGPKNATYSATKAFVRSFTEAVHEEVLKSGVHVTALCPGFTRTEFQKRAGMEASNVPSFMWARPDPVAAAGLEALERNAAVCIPGFVNKAGAVLTRFVPLCVSRKMAGQVLDHM
ncbi:MAG: SDR family oxidoreductase [Acidimicrobiales bacterium]